MDLIHAEGDEPNRLAFAHLAQVQTSFYTGDLAGVEEHFAVISPMLDNADQQQAPGNNQISLGVAACRRVSPGARKRREPVLPGRAPSPTSRAIPMTWESGCTSQAPCTSGKRIPWPPRRRRASCSSWPMTAV